MVLEPTILRYLLLGQVLFHRRSHVLVTGSCRIGQSCAVVQWLFDLRGSGSCQQSSEKRFGQHLGGNAGDETRKTKLGGRELPVVTTQVFP